MVVTYREEYIFKWLFLFSLLIAMCKASHLVYKILLEMHFYGLYLDSWLIDNLQ
jgi:hypothetical protein